MSNEVKLGDLFVPIVTYNGVYRNTVSMVVDFKHYDWVDLSALRDSGTRNRVIEGTFFYMNVACRDEAKPLERL